MEHIFFDEKDKMNPKVVFWICCDDSRRKIFWCLFFKH